MIKLSTSKIKFSGNDIRRCIKIPTVLSAELAEDVGHHIGDGYLKCPDRQCHYELSYSVCNPDDIQYFRNVLIPRKCRLFNLKDLNLEFFKNSKEIRVRFRSKAIASFYLDVLDVKESPKENIQVPKWVFKSIEFQKAFLRGLIDSDGCFTIKKKYYPVISVSSKSIYLSNSIKNILKDLGFTCTLSKINAYDKRYNKYNKKFCIEINGKKNLARWIKTVGFNNIKHINKYEKWKGRWSSGYEQ